MTEQHELLENTASRVDEGPGTAEPADPPGFDIPPIEEDHGEPDKTVRGGTERLKRRRRPAVDRKPMQPLKTQRSRMCLVWYSAFLRRMHDRRRTAEPG